MCFQPLYDWGADCVMLRQFSKNMYMDFISQTGKRTDLRQTPKCEAIENMVSFFF